MADVEEKALQESTKLPATLPDGASGGEATDASGHYGLDGVSFDLQAGVMVGSAAEAAAPAQTFKSTAATPKSGHTSKSKTRAAKPPTQS